MDKERKINRISDKIKYARDTELYLASDLSTLSQAVNAVSKYTVGKTPTKTEEKCLQQILDDYSSFFEDDNEQGEELTPQPKNPADSVSLLGRLVLVKNYLTQEKSVNSNILDKLKQGREDLRARLYKSSLDQQGGSSSSSVTKKDESSKLGTIEMGESSKPSRAEPAEPAIPESLEPRVKRVRFALPSDEKGKGKAREQDNLPDFDEFHNPFDDIGID